MSHIDESKSTGLEAGDMDNTQMRRKSAGQIEITDKSGRRKTVTLEELSEADRALAEKFGYKPVCLPWLPLLVARAYPNDDHRSSSVSSAISRPSRSPSVSLVSSPPLQPPLSSLWKLVELQLLFGVGSSRAPDACVSRAPWPNLSPRIQ